MDTIGEQSIWSFFDTKRSARPSTNGEIRRGRGHRVGSFLELATKIAELQFRNRDHVLMFRGQSRDHHNIRKSTSLKSTLFRGGHGNPAPGELVERFTQLKAFEAQLIRRYEKAKLLGVERLKRHRILRWAVLQHYEVCPTPLLDVTHSLRIAASFASLNPKAEAYLFVLGVPNLSGAITASAEAGLQIVRLSSVCPPSAVRPHIQEGYLLGEYPDIAGFDQKENYFPYEMDFGRRLVAKFRFHPATFWKDPHFPKVPQGALYPKPGDDPLETLCASLRSQSSVEP